MANGEVPLSSLAHLDRPWVNSSHAWCLNCLFAFPAERGASASGPVSRIVPPWEGVHDVLDGQFVSPLDGAPLPGAGRQSDAMVEPDRELVAKPHRPRLEMVAPMEPFLLLPSIETYWPGRRSQSMYPYIRTYGICENFARHCLRRTGAMQQRRGENRKSQLKQKNSSLVLPNSRSRPESWNEFALHCLWVAFFRLSRPSQLLRTGHTSYTLRFSTRPPAL